MRGDRDERGGLLPRRARGVGAPSQAVGRERDVPGDLRARDGRRARDGEVGHAAPPPPSARASK
eukprot:31363-Pelagococcus_subviridis.AAC.13